MGGHGGLNILPQKRWNVYNFDNREKVRQDEEAAAKEEQLKREQARKRDSEFRLEILRQARGLAPSAQASSASSPATESGSKSKPKESAVASLPESESKSKLNHINLFEGIKIFDPVSGVEGKGEDERGAFKKMKMTKKEAAPRVVVMPEDEKYRLGYGIAGKGVKLPWYLSRPSDAANLEREDDDDDYHKEEAKSSGKKTLEQLREERLKREKKEKERERALMLEKRLKREKEEKERERALIREKGRRDGPVLKGRGFSRRSGK